MKRWYCKRCAKGLMAVAVYDCDNDVVDHQVVNFLFERGATAAFTMTAFARGRGRETRIFGTKGELFSDDEKIEVFDFLTDE